MLKIILDEGRCRGAGFCEQVCPKNCFEMGRVRHIATMPRSHECVQYGACIVQCSFDALYFKSPKDDVITPDAIRIFKIEPYGETTYKGKEDIKMMEPIKNTSAFVGR